MATTQIPWGDPRAVNRYSAILAADVPSASYFGKKFVGKGENNIIEEKTELESDAGDTIQFDLVADLRGQPIFGDDRAAGKEDQLKFATDKVVIDQMRYPVSLGGRMSRKRVEHDLREVGRSRLKNWFAQIMDQIHFMVLSGGRGVNEDYILPQGTTSFNGNGFLAPDTAHLMYGGSATSKATLTATDKMTRKVIEDAITKTKMLKALNPDLTNIVPMKIDGTERHVLLMSTLQEADLRVDIGAGNWFDLQKAMAASDGANNAIFKGGLGLLNGAVLHSHQSVMRYADYGAGSNVKAARALLLGCQAAVVAYGTTENQRFLWKEEVKDYGNEPAILGGYIYGEKKTRFNGYDFGVMAIDTAVNW